ncbi:hypothetical protein LF1_00210 [Rubripirellula obstinata]|uniref:Uncharacterized protein n=1 Tax=Rubripirellula obstinata TaxID=406547 RepID=A0A5B1CDW1_9BACT|nr:hypothetical protein LF1_00210 [Rubripirellula obstinata]
MSKFVIRYWYSSFRSPAIVAVTRNGMAVWRVGIVVSVPLPHVGRADVQVSSLTAFWADSVWHQQSVWRRGSESFQSDNGMHHRGGGI